MIKRISLIKRKPGLTYEEFDQYWKEKHGPLAVKVLPGLRKYIQNHLVRTPGVNYEIDGIVETWYDDLAAFQRLQAWRQSAEAKVLIEDEEKFLDKSNPCIYFVEEHIMK